MVVTAGAVAMAVDAAAVGVAIGEPLAELPVAPHAPLSDHAIDRSHQERRRRIVSRMHGPLPRTIVHCIRSTSPGTPANEEEPSSRTSVALPTIRNGTIGPPRETSTQSPARSELSRSTNTALVNRAVAEKESSASKRSARNAQRLTGDRKCHWRWRPINGVLSPSTLHRCCL